MGGQADTQQQPWLRLKRPRNSRAAVLSHVKYARRLYERCRRSRNVNQMADTVVNRCWRRVGQILERKRHKSERCQAAKKIGNPHEANHALTKIPKSPIWGLTSLAADVNCAVSTESDKTPNKRLHDKRISDIERGQPGFCERHANSCFTTSGERDLRSTRDSKYIQVSQRDNCRNSLQGSRLQRSRLRRK